MSVYSWLSSRPWAGKNREERRRTSSSRVLRGGSWNNNNRDNLLSSNRNNNDPTNRNNNIGFRVVMGVEARKGALLPSGCDAAWEGPASPEPVERAP